MADQSFFEIAFEEAQNLLQTEADGFAAVLQSLAGFDIVNQAGDAISIFEGAGTALLTLFFCMEAFTYCASIDFNGGIEGAIRVAMKLVVSALIVQNVDNIVGIISGLFRSEVDFASAFDGIGAAFGDAMNQGRDKLIKLGVPEQEIAFIHDYDTAEKKQALFNQMNSGEIRVLLGSTAKCGAGMNSQQKMIALHHLDAPLRPSDVEHLKRNTEKSIEQAVIY